METKIFLIITIVCIILFVVIIIVRNKFDNKTSRKKKTNSPSEQIDIVPKSIKIYPLAPTGHEEEIEKISLEIQSFSKAIINAKEIFNKNEYLIVDTLAFITFIIRFKFKNILSEEDIESRIIDDFLVNISSEFSMKKMVNIETFFDLYEKRTDELLTMEYSKGKYALEVMDVIADLSVAMNHELHYNKEFPINKQTVVQVLLTDEMFYYFIDLGNLSKSISELCETSIKQ